WRSRCALWPNDLRLLRHSARATAVCAEWFALRLHVLHTHACAHQSVDGIRFRVIQPARNEGILQNVEFYRAGPRFSSWPIVTLWKGLGFGRKREARRAGLRRVG